MPVSRHALLCLVILMPLTLALGCPKKPPVPLPEYSYDEEIIFSVILPTPQDDADTWPDQQMFMTPDGQIQYLLKGKVTFAWEHDAEWAPEDNLARCSSGYAMHQWSNNFSTRTNHQHISRQSVSAVRFYDWNGDTESLPIQIEFEVRSVAVGNVTAAGRSWSSCPLATGMTTVAGGTQWMMGWYPPSHGEAASVRNVGGTVTPNAEGHVTGERYYNPPGAYTPLPGTETEGNFAQQGGWYHILFEPVTVMGMFVTSSVSTSFSARCDQDIRASARGCIDVKTYAEADLWTDMYGGSRIWGLTE